jgi:hypothetical protein
VLGCQVEDIPSTQNFASFEGVERGDLLGVTIFLGVTGTLFWTSSSSDVTTVLRRFPSRTIYNQSDLRNGNDYLGYG